MNLKIKAMTDNTVHNILAYVAQKCSQFIINTTVEKPGTYIHT